MMIVVTGGSGSGKSAFAESQVLALKNRPRIYIATMRAWDDEGRRRVERHRRMRAGKGFETIECYTDLANVQIPEGSTVLLECMSNLTANEMFEENGARENTVQAVLAGVKNLKRQAEHLVIVTNEIFSEAASYGTETEQYQAYLGKINQEIVRMADQAVEVVYGIPVYLKKGAASGEDAVE